MQLYICLLFALTISLAKDLKPVDWVGGMNPEFGDFFPAKPTTIVDESDPEAKKNYPKCGVYEGTCMDKLILSKQYIWTFSGYKEDVPSFLQLNVTYYSNRKCNNTGELVHLSYTWFVLSIDESWMLWKLRGNNLFLRIGAGEIFNTIKCPGVVDIIGQIVNIQQLNCNDLRENGLIMNYKKHFNHTVSLRLRFAGDNLVTLSTDVIPPLSIFDFMKRDSVESEISQVSDITTAGLLDGAMESNIKYTRVKDLGCCNKSPETNSGVIVTIVVVVVAVIVIGAVAAVVIIKVRGKKTLPKTATK